MQKEKAYVFGSIRVSCVITYKRVKWMHMRVKPDGKLYISAPIGTSDAYIDGMVEANHLRIACAVKAARRRAAEKEKSLVIADGVVKTVFGEKMTLNIVKSGRNDCVFSGGKITLFVKDVNDEKLKARVYDKYYKQYVKSVITEMCEKYYPFFKDRVETFPELKFRAMTSRWGSCTPKKNRLTFNYNLALVPKECSEYVVVHEFSHFFEGNHSERFYAVVARVMPDYKERRAILKKVVLK